MISNSKGDLVRILRGGFTLATQKEKIKMLMLALLTLLIGFLDMIAIGSIMPFVGLLMDPVIVQRNTMFASCVALIGSPPIEKLVPIVGMACLSLVIASGAAGLLLQRKIGRFTANCQLRLARSLMTKVLQAPIIWHVVRNSATIAYSVQQHVLIWAREFILKGLGVIRDLLMVLLPAIFLIIVAPTWGLVSLFLVSIAVGLVMLWVKPKIIRLAKLKNDAYELANLKAFQALAGIKDVKVSGRENVFVDTFAASYASYANGSAALSNWHMVPFVVILLAGQVGLFVVALTLWWLSSSSAELASQLALLVMVTSRVLPAANRLSTATTTFFGAAPSVQAILDLNNNLGSTEVAKDSKLVPLIVRPWNKIELTNVCFTYPNSDRESLQNISLTIHAKRSYGVVGGSGAGKSTLVDLVAGLLTPQKGDIFIDGCKLLHGNHRKWQSNLSYVSQHPYITDDTLRANIAFGITKEGVDECRLYQAISAAGLIDLMNDLPYGLDTVLGDRGVRLSGGQRQRVAIARALYDEVDLLILDEATSALDNITEREVQKSLSDITGFITTLTVAHRLSTIRNANQIFVLDRGVLVDTGNWEHLINNSPIFRSLVDAQSNEGV